MIGFLLLGILIVSVLWEILYRYQWSKEVFVRLWYDAAYVYAGQETKLYEVVENRKKIPVPVLEVGFHTQKELHFANADNTNVSDYLYKRDIFAILGRQKITREIPVQCPKRGRYPVKDAEITAYSLLYGKRYHKQIETSAEIYVYPKMTDVSDLMAVCEQMLGTVSCAKRLYEDPFAFRTIRSYTTDDPMKTINWKASAKTGALMVNTYDSAQSLKTMIFLDVEDAGILKCGELVEESIAMAATLVRKLLGQNIEVGFSYNGGGPLMLPTNDKSALTGLERMLAEYDPETVHQDFAQMVKELFAGAFSKKPLSQDTLLLFLSKNLSDRMMADIRDCSGAYQALVVVPVYRGEKSEQRDRIDAIRSTDNVKLLIREVERG
ncbi:MAG: DUF58 domain-containing protein [Bacteroidales bacterium]|nr:DUF58 domain-containing protein [Bacteroidales bacterium]MCM1417021.1 DUF58 domain-containing protein [bacterium]MCM1424558.1 DUF58 domain-containing protein [bacterium]